MQYSAKGENVRRQRVVNNLPGTQSFCPLVFRSEILEKFISLDLKGRAQKVIDQIPKDVMSRTAAFLLLKDSRASFIIEDEAPPAKRIERWGRIIGEAGRIHISPEELIQIEELFGDLFDG